MKQSIITPFQLEHFLLKACDILIGKSFNLFRLKRWFKIGQLVSSAMFSLGIGANDAQKVMGIISATLLVHFKFVDPSAFPEWARITNNDALWDRGFWNPGQYDPHN
jgi:hypothetical protein